MPPQPNCPPTDVPQERLAAQILKDGVSLSPKLPSTLYIRTRTATAGYSKVSRGLHFPLEVTGLCTSKSIRRTLGRDSRDLVKPFMHVVI